MSGWDDISWEALEGLREGFLGGGATLRADYWRSGAQLASYDWTFARRIGWKWDAVLSEARDRGYVHPHGALLLDWGCGTGIAARRYLAAIGAEGIPRVVLHDRSKAAMLFAERALLAESAASLAVERATELVDPPAVPYVLLASHVLSELDESGYARLFALVRGSAASFLVEPGTPAQSRTLIGLREELRGERRIVAPCPHARACGLLDPARADDWCHNFAKPPSEVFRDGNWAAFGKRMGIDLRSLPVSFLVTTSEPAREGEAGLARVLGRARTNKVGATALACDAAGVTPRLIAKRHEKRLVKELDDGGFTHLVETERMPKDPNG